MPMNDTDCPVNVPGLWHNGDCSLLCRKTEWYDVLIFFLGNYVAHVATVTNKPGENFLRRTLFTVTALFFPGLGLNQGLWAIRSWAIFANTPLQTAARAGALCMVAHDKQGGNSVSADAEVEQQDSDPGRPYLSAVIHGRTNLPRGYKLIMVPWDAEFEDDHVYQSWSWWKRTTKGMRRIVEKPVDIACDFNLIKSLVSICQVIFGAVTLYRTQGNEIERYGYAAFGLTVTPYVWMSMINLLGNLIRPNYPAVYLVESPLLDTVIKKYGSCCARGAVGRLKTSSADRIQEQYPRRHLGHTTKLDSLLSDKKHKITSTLGKAIRHHILSPIRRATRHNYPATERARSGLGQQKERNEGGVADAAVLVGPNGEVHEAKPRVYHDPMRLLLGISVPLIILGVLSKFSKGDSTHAQRVWIMCWFAFGNVSTVFDYFTETLSVLDRSTLDDISVFLGALAYATPAIGGFVVVSKMIYEHGICSKMIV